mmetsp:Transcript_43600/g.131939  ORF Transcript_43600/g.131939 Transcript_43600/m.131939 type:complete len:221 (+) Transcript_43600:416-1078(+)
MYKIMRQKAVSTMNACSAGLSMIGPAGGGRPSSAAISAIRRESSFCVSSTASPQSRESTSGSVVAVPTGMLPEDLPAGRSASSPDSSSVSPSVSLPSSSSLCEPLAGAVCRALPNSTRAKPRRPHSSSKHTGSSPMPQPAMKWPNLKEQRQTHNTQIKETNASKTKPFMKVMASSPIHVAHVVSEPHKPDARPVARCWFMLPLCLAITAMRMHPNMFCTK